MAAVPVAGPNPMLDPDIVALERGRLRVEIALQPFERDGSTFGDKGCATKRLIERLEFPTALLE